MLILAWANAHDYEIPFQAIAAFVFHRKLYAAHILYAVDKINWEFGPQIIHTERIWISDVCSGVFSPFLNMLLQAAWGSSEFAKEWCKNDNEFGSIHPTCIAEIILED